MAVIEPGVLPSISFAAHPTACPPWSTSPECLCTATTEGSLRMMPSPRTQTRVLHVPRSIPMSTVNMERKRWVRLDSTGLGLRGRVRWKRLRYQGLGCVSAIAGTQHGNYRSYRATV